MIELKPLEHYQKLLDELRKRNKYAKNWKLEIKKYSNRHRDTWGHSWGWYEIWPLEITIGFWGEEKDDFAGFDITEWNRCAVENDKK